MFRTLFGSTILSSGTINLEIKLPKGFTPDHHQKIVEKIHNELKAGYSRKDAKKAAIARLKSLLA
ncbi:MAG: hypothetical protein A3D53_01805 [Candidatus Magasanikbacteria bacterium RIFCSPHIGHO2_02_FULL_45_10]|uniref:Uncharacterized protein n=1 Tax=Candidatus Magasanikbacteria bacterium RIFCSPHIGHO2_02_FULL_45_10 TaxID=1798679 RepID=A0A1F6MC09_9BACT|nr:MAG: hypothetical protein A3D53_01805 [Candidatus Magasanikbacteria bacterium RIFCSPHIGHO2_02_FULL_45_10]